VNISLDTLDPGKFSRLTGNGCIDNVFRGIEAALEAGLDPVKINMVVFPDTRAEEVRQMRGFCRFKGLQLQTIRKFSLDRKVEDKLVPADRPPDCVNCNRLRLTVDGFLLPCLF
ncbi:radical SAM protein, partial [Fibrobacterota bacterium]